jgi:hypothetical protein
MTTSTGKTFAVSYDATTPTTLKRSNEHTPTSAKSLPEDIAVLMGLCDDTIHHATKIMDYAMNMKIKYDKRLMGPPKKRIKLQASLPTPKSLSMKDISFGSTESDGEKEVMEALKTAADELINDLSP